MYIETFKVNLVPLNFNLKYLGRSQRPRGLRRGSAAARLLELWVGIPPGEMHVCLL